MLDANSRTRLRLIRLAHKVRNLFLVSPDALPTVPRATKHANAGTTGDSDYPGLLMMSQLVGDHYGCKPATNLVKAWTLLRGRVRSSDLAKLSRRGKFR